MRVSLFSVFYSEANIIDNSCFNGTCVIPIQTGRASTHVTLDMLGDDSGDNISQKNPDYGELTAWYWVWKNWLPIHPECEYIGFTQYRRLPIMEEPKGHYLKTISKQNFLIKAQSLTEERVLDFIGEAEMVVVKKWNTLVSTEWEFTSFLPPEEWLMARKAFTNGDSEKENFFDNVLKQTSARYKCNFIMRTDLFSDLCSWLFNMLFAFERNRQEISDGNLQKSNRICAFITECFINLWISEKEQQKSVKIKDMCIYEANFPLKRMSDNINRFKWFVHIFSHLNNVRRAKLLIGEAYKNE